MYCYMPKSLALGREQEDYKFKTILSYVVGP